MSPKSTFWTIVLSIFIIFQAMIVPVASVPLPHKKYVPFPQKLYEIEKRQSPLTPSQFALAATRFIVMLPFLPMMMFVPGVTAVLMPMFLALQDRLQTIAPAIAGNVFGVRPPNNPAGIGSVSNQGVTVSTTSTEAPETTTASTYYRFKRALPKLPTKKIKEELKEMVDFLQKTDDVVNLLTSTQPDCRRQAVCRLHHLFDPRFGKFLGNVFEVLKLENKVQKLDVSDTTRTIIKDALQAANTGLFQQNCATVYPKCSIVLSGV